MQHTSDICLRHWIFEWTSVGLVLNCLFKKNILDVEREGVRETCLLVQRSSLAVTHRIRMTHLCLSALCDPIQNSSTFLQSPVSPGPRRCPISKTHIPVARTASTIDPAHPKVKARRCWETKSRFRGFERERWRERGREGKAKWMDVWWFTGLWSDTEGSGCVRELMEEMICETSWWLEFDCLCACQHWFPRTSGS